MPRMPSVVPLTSAPLNISKVQRFQCPARSQRSDSPTRRAAASSSAQAWSAVASFSTSGVLVASTPCLVHAARSMLL